MQETYKRVDRFIALKNHEDKLLKALIKDLGYSDTDIGVKWLKSQPWYTKDIGTGFMYAYNINGRPDSSTMSVGVIPALRLHR